MKVEVGDMLALYQVYHRHTDRYDKLGVVMSVHKDEAAPRHLRHDDYVVVQTTEGDTEKWYLNYCKMVSSPGGARGGRK